MIEDEPSARAWVQNLEECDDLAMARLDRLIEILAEENTRQNLVAAASLEHVWQRHIADSAQLLTYVPRGAGGTWLDLGAGAGFPGLVVAILRPEVEMTLVESRRKRAEWLERLAEMLDLTNTHVVASRLEAVETQKMHVISARAFAPLDRLLPLSARFSTASTQWLLPKGRSAAHELETLTGWQHMFHVEQSLTDPEAGIIVGQLHDKARHGR